GAADSRAGGARRDLRARAQHASRGMLRRRDRGGRRRSGAPVHEHSEPAPRRRAGRLSARRPHCLHAGTDGAVRGTARGRGAGRRPQGLLSFAPGARRVLLRRGPRPGDVRRRAGVSRRRAARGLRRAHAGRGARLSLGQCGARLRRGRAHRARMTADLGATVAGLRLEFCAMNAAGTVQRPEDLERMLASRAGALVLRTATVHPFVHPEFRSLHNPGYDKLVPLARELAATRRKPIVASIAGSTPEEYALLARAFAEAGAALVEVDVADPWVAASLAPLEEPGALRALLERIAAAGVRVVVIRNDFTGLEKFLLEAGGGFTAIARGGIRSGYDLARALAHG